MQSAIIASLAASAVAAPFISRRQATAAPQGGDATILNYALSLEHLEATFYREALAKFTLEDFQAVGLGADFLDNLKEIAHDEATHVDFLTTGLTTAGATPAQECKYNFGYTDVQGFLATANVLEGVGVSAYLGAANVIANPDYITAAGAILTVEARHSAYLRGNQEPKPLSPFPAPFDIPLDFNQVFSLAAPFVVSCPDGKAGTLGLPFKAYPSIAVSPAAVAKPGDVLQFTVKEKVDAKKAYFITFPGGAIEAKISSADGTTYQVTVPEAAQPGQAYVVLTSGGDKPTDDNTVAGPAVFQVLDNAGKFQEKNPDYPYKCEEKSSYGGEKKDASYGGEKKDASYGGEKKDASYGGEKSAPSYSAPAYPSKPAEHKAPSYNKPSEHEAPKYMSTEHGKPAEYHPKPSEHKSTETKAAEYPSKPAQHKAPVYKSTPAEHKAPEHNKPADVYQAPEYTPTSGAEHKPNKVEHAPIYDKAGHAYPLNSEGHVCVYDQSTGKDYPLDKYGKPYYHDEKENKYYTVDYQGNKEPCEESYHPY